MGRISDHKQIEICERLSIYSAEQLHTILIQAGIVPGIAGVSCQSVFGLYPKDSEEPPKDLLGAIIYHLRMNYHRVLSIIQKHHNDIATMVYSLGLIAGNQYIISGDVNRMTLVYTVLMYFAKVGFDKVLSEIK